MFAGYELPAKLDLWIWKSIYLFVIADDKSCCIRLKLGTSFTTSRHPSPGRFGGVDSRGRVKAAFQLLRTKSLSCSRIFSCSAFLFLGLGKERCSHNAHTLFPLLKAGVMHSYSQRHFSSSGDNKIADRLECGFIRGKNWQNSLFLILLFK